MASFTFLGRTLDLPAVQAPENVATREPTAWQSGHFVTVRLVEAIPVIRVHANGNSFPGHYSSPKQGAWVLIGDVGQTSSSLMGSQRLTARNSQSTVAMGQTSEAYVPANTILNIGLASAKFGGSGRELQAEYVGGPAMDLDSLADKH